MASVVEGELETTRLVGVTTDQDQTLESRAGVASGTSSNDPSIRTNTPLPWRVITVLCIVNAMQPVAFDLIFPFINQMIVEIGVTDDPEQVGFYSGVIESIYNCTCFLAIIPLSHVADRLGRKPVILLGMAGLSVSISLFGLSRSYMFMIITRSLAGIAGASWSMSEIMIGELTDKSNQATAFSGLVISYKVGQIGGQAIGGLLAHPERRFPWFDSEFWYHYPYAFPCFIAGALAIITVILGSFLLEETLASKRTVKVLKSTTYGATEHLEPIKKTLTPPLRSVLSPLVISVLFSTFAMVLASEMLFAVYPLFAFTPIVSGGLGVDEVTIGTHMAIRSFLNIGTMFLYQSLERRLGTVRLYQLMMWFWPLSVVFMPLLNYLARRGDISTWVFNIVLALFFTAWGMASLTWTGFSIMVNNAAPSADALATINGVSQMSIILPQAISPAFVTSLFAFSIKSDIAGGNFVWIVLFGLTIATAVHSLTLWEPRHDWRQG